MPQMPKRFIGNGVYADFDWHNGLLILTTEDHIAVTNRIILNMEAVAGLKKLLVRIDKELEKLDKKKEIEE